MKCPYCKAENTDTNMFCGECGLVIRIQERLIQPKPSWFKSNLKTVLGITIIVIAIVILAVLPYSQPWSKVKVLVSNGYPYQAEFDLWIDWNLTASLSVSPTASGYQIIGVWPIEPGVFTISVDGGSWHWVGSVYSGYWEYTEPDGIADLVYKYQVGPFSTKNVFIDL